MALNVAVNTRRMPHTTQFSRMIKAPEHLYYFLLLGTNPSYAKNQDVWTSWLQMGFGLALREGPPGSAKADSLKITVHHTPRRIESVVEGGHKETVAKLEKLMKAIEGLRPSVASKDEAGRAQAVAANKEVAAQLLAPVEAAFKANGLRPQEIASFHAPLNQALFTLTDPDITSLEVGAGVKVAA